MNVVNRVLIVLMLLIAMVLCTLLLVLPVPVLDAVAQQSADLADVLDSVELYVRMLLGVFFALILDGIFLLLIVLELRRPSRKALRVEKASGGEVLISVGSIADRIKYEVDQLSSVLRTRPRVSGKRSGVVVELDVEGAAGINVPQKAEEIVRAVQRVVEEDMGLKLARLPKVNLRVVPYPKGPKPPVWPEEVLPAQPKVVPPAEPEEIPLAEPTEWFPDESGDDLPDLPEGFGEAL